jgi:hypothetical protein
MEEWRQAFLASVLNQGEWIASRVRRFNPGRPWSRSGQCGGDNNHRRRELKLGSSGRSLSSTPTELSRL